MKNIFMVLLTWVISHLLFAYYLYATTGMERVSSYFSDKSILIALMIYVPLSLVAIILLLLPSLLCHTEAKWIIFLLNFFTGFTGIGWILLMVWALISNHNADKREYELALRELDDIY